MKCCSVKKAILFTAVLGVGAIVLANTGWGEYAWSKAKSAMKHNIPPQARLDKARLAIAKLDSDIERNWTPIAEEEHEIKKLKKDIDSVRASVERSESELASAVAELKSGTKRIKYAGRDRTEAETRKALIADANTLASRKNELENKERQLDSKEKTLSAAMATQEEMFRQRTELDAEVSALEAELKVLKYEETKTKLVINNGSRLDDIKQTLAEVRKEIAVRKRVLELQQSHSTSDNTVNTFDKSKELTNDEVISRVNSVLNRGKDVGNGE